MDVVKEAGSEFPILGVCLGHQAICAAFGGTVSYAKELMHGKQSQAKLDRSCPIFQHLPEFIPVARYHSLALLEDTLPVRNRPDAGRRSDGGKAQGLPYLRIAVPPGIHPHAGRKNHCK